MFFVRIECPDKGSRLGFVAGLYIGLKAAPIIKYMAPWSLSKVIAHCKRKSWECSIKIVDSL